MKEFELFSSQYRCAVLILVVCSLMISCQTAVQQPVKAENPEIAGWTTSAEYHQAFEKRMKDGYYPSWVEGRCEDGCEKFHAEWKGLPLGAGFASYHGLTKESYDAKKQEYTSKGYSQVCLTIFKDCSGTERYQATWFRKAK